VLSIDWIDLEVITGQIAYFRGQQEIAEHADQRETLVKAIGEAESQRQRLLDAIFHKFICFTTEPTSLNA
jgi:hypothetical protein